MKYILRLNYIMLKSSILINLFYLNSNFIFLKWIFIRKYGLLGFILNLNKLKFLGLDICILISVLFKFYIYKIWERKLF